MGATQYSRQHSSCSRQGTARSEKDQPRYVFNHPSKWNLLISSGSSLHSDEHRPWILTVCVQPTPLVLAPFVWRFSLTALVAHGVAHDGTGTYWRTVFSPTHTFVEVLSGDQDDRRQEYSEPSSRGPRYDTVMRKVRERCAEEIQRLLPLATAVLGLARLPERFDVSGINLLHHGGPLWGVPPTQHERRGSRSSAKTDVIKRCQRLSSSRRQRRRRQPISITPALTIQPPERSGPWRSSIYPSSRPRTTNWLLSSRMSTRSCSDTPWVRWN